MAKWICNVGTVRVEADSLPQFIEQIENANKTTPSGR